MSKEINYALGLDIGITSVGWAVIKMDNELNPIRIEDLGVRIFNAAENPKDGSSLATPRRTARGRRRLLRRKSYRIKRVKKLIISNNILSEEKLEDIFKNPTIPSVWQARVKGLDNLLTDEEWAKILINLCKRRGFKSNRKNEAKDEEMGQILTNIKKNKEKMLELGCRTVGELIYNETLNSGDQYKAFRNKFGEYSRCVSRDMIREEIQTLFEMQRKFGNKHASDKIEDSYLEIFNSQRPYSDFGQLEKMVGFCTFEKNCRRAPKNCLTAEEFVLYESINKLAILNNGAKRVLSEGERKEVIKEAFNKKEIKYSALRKLLDLKQDDRFSTLTYSIDKDVSKTENTKFIAMKGYHEIKRAIELGISKECWNEIKDDRNFLNNIAYVLSLAKTDEEIKKQMELRGISDEIIEQVMDISFSKFNNLSIKAMDKIIPFLKEGLQYDKACEKAGYDFKNIYKGEKEKKLPIIKIEEIVNPVVIRALAQTRKVINAVIEKYGSPVRINIELARDLAKNWKDRKSIEKEQKENRDNIEKVRKDLRELIEKEPTSGEILKYRLWQQQRGECAYTQRKILINDLFDHGYCEIDHIIPFSRSFDDSLSNKVLVLGTENQRKGNRTPYEYFGHDIERWNQFEIWVKGSFLNYKKKNNLVKKKFSKEEQDEWKARNLNDTKYICRYISNYVNNRLLFKETSKKQHVITVNGKATAYLRKMWGLNKVRENGDKHHALDAAVVAVTTQGMVQKISHYSKAHELEFKRINDEYVDIETGKIINICEYEEDRKNIFPRPWLGFSEELRLRLSDNPLEELEKSPIYTYDKEFIKTTVRPIFVSRVPFRKSGGKLFKETIYSKAGFKENYFVTKKKLSELTKKDLDNLYNYSCDKLLYDAVIEKMESNNFNAKKAFAEEFRKPTSSGKIGPVVRSIKVKTTVPFKDGIELNEGVCAKEGMVRIDIYEKEGKYYVVPVYRYQLLLGNIPKKAATAAKREDEWPVMDETYKFKLSVFKNDLIEIKYKKKKGYFGYYDGFDRATASLAIEKHDTSERYRGIGIKSDVDSISKYEVDVLGRYNKVKEGN